VIDVINKIAVVWFCFLAIGTLATPSMAQPGSTCSTLVEEALDVLGSNCSELGRNTACYGNFSVDADFKQDVTEDVEFTNPTDRSPIEVIETLRTGAFDEENGVWGIAVMNVQANIPGTLPGQGVTYLLLGGAEVTDASETSDDYSPMQAFYFTAGVGSGQCNDAPSSLAVRSPENIQVDLNVNGIDVTIGSTIILTEEADADDGTSTITFYVEEGALRVDETGEIVTQGNSVDTTTDADGNIVEVGDPRPATDDEKAVGEQVNNAYDALEEPSETSETEDTSSITTYVVQPGDNLFRIALNNDTCVSAIARVNNIPEANVRVISVGQVLIIPDGSTCTRGTNDVNPVVIPQVPPGPTPEVTPSNGEDEVIVVDCSGFGATSPLDGLPAGAATFFWNAAPGATSYTINVYKNGAVVASQSVDASATSALISLESIQSDDTATYMWEVLALSDGEVRCTSQSPTLQREWRDIRDDTGDDNNDDDDGFVCDAAAYAALLAAEFTNCTSGYASTDAATCSYVCY
jgi:LysM repeat protein